jgi:hypothetical protein
MPHLTLQEVIDRVNNDSSRKELRAADARAVSQSHRPEFYVPRITRIFAGLWFGAFTTGRMAGAKAKSTLGSIVESTAGTDLFGFIRRESSLATVHPLSRVQSSGVTYEVSERLPPNLQYGPY